MGLLTAEEATGSGDVKALAKTEEPPTVRITFDKFHVTWHALQLSTSCAESGGETTGRSRARFHQSPTGRTYP